MALLLFFGKLADMAGARKREWPLEGETCSVRDLVGAIAQEEPDFAAALSGSSIRYVVNETMAGIDSAVSDEDEIAFLPPVSGG
jgi:molybdopterin synthase sulfur carrier subunit